MKPHLPLSLKKWINLFGCVACSCSSAVYSADAISNITTNTTKTTHLLIDSLDSNQIYKISDNITLTWSSGLLGGIFGTVGGGAATVTSGKTLTFQPTGVSGTVNFKDSYTGGLTLSLLPQHGGAIYTEGALNITNGVFSGNIAGKNLVSFGTKVHGGGIYSQGAGTINLNNVSFTSNKTSGGSGGAIYHSGASLSINKGSFSGNAALDNGGAMAIVGGTAGTLIDLSFNNNTAGAGNSSGGYGGAIYADSNLTLNVSAGTSLTSSGNAAYSNATTVNAQRGGFMYLASGTSATINVGAGGSYTIGAAGDTSANDSISGADATVGLIKNGTGALTINSSMFYMRGSIALNAGTINVNRSNSIDGASSVQIASGATLNLTGKQTIKSLDLKSGGVLNMTGDSADMLTINSGTINGTFNSSLELLKASTGVLTINTKLDGFTNVLSLQGGSIVLGTANAIASSYGILCGGSNLLVDTQGYDQLIQQINGGNAEIMTRGGNLELAIFSKGFSGTLTLGSGGLTVGSGEISSTVLIQGMGSFTKNGTGTLVINNDLNGYSGPISVTGGTLSLGMASLLDASSTVSISSGARIQTQGYDQLIDLLTGAGDIDTSNGNLTVNTATNYSGNISLGTGDLTINSGSISGAISGSGDVIKTGAGLLTLSGVSSGFTGNVQINSGSLNLGVSNALSSANVNVTTGTSLNTQGYSQVLASLTGSGSVNTANGDLTVTTANNFTGAVSLGTGSLTVGSGQISGSITGSGLFTKNGAGILTLTNANAGFTGNVVVDAGTLRLDVADAMKMATSINVVAGAILDTCGLDQIFASLSGEGILSTGGGNVKIGVINGLDLNIGTGIVHVDSGLIDGVITGTGELIKQTTGSLSIIGDMSSFTGDLSITAGDLSVSVADTLSGASSIDIAAGATLNLQGTDQVIKSLTCGGKIIAGGADLDIRVANNITGVIEMGGGNLIIGSGIISATITGASSLISAGNVSLSSDITLDVLDVTQGALTIAAGTKVDLDSGIQVHSGASLNGSAVLNILDGGILCATGGVVDFVLEAGSSITGSSVVEAGGELNLTMKSKSLWEVVEDSTLTSLIVESGAHLSFNINNLDDFSNLVATTLTLKAGAVIDINFYGIDLQSEVCLMLFAGIGDAVNITAEEGVLVNLNGLDGATYNLDNITNGCVTITPDNIPEPTTVTLSLLGLGGLLMRRRRQVR